MSTFKSLALLLCIILFSSCNSSDDKNNSINGTWNASALTGNGTVSIENPLFNINSTFTLEGSDLDVQTTFNEDGTYITSGTATFTVVNTVDGVSDTEVNENEPVNGSGSYTQTETMLQFTDSDGETTEFNIIEMSSNKLVLRSMTSTMETDSGSTVSTVTNSESEYTR